jgi:hypothetical protein
MKGREKLEDPVVGGSIILKLILVGGLNWIHLAQTKDLSGLL